MIALPAVADDTFVDSRGLVRHANKDLPAIIPMDEALTAGPDTPFHYTGQKPYQPAPASIVSAPGVQAMGGYYGAGNISSYALRGRTEDDEGSVTGVVRQDFAHPFHDGGDNRVLSRYHRDAEYVDASFTPAKDVKAQITGVRDAFNNYRLPNYGVDVPSMQQSTLKAAVTASNLGGFFDQGKVSLKWDYLDGDSDNYTLRQPSSVQVRYLSVKQTVTGAGWLARTTETGRQAIGADLSYDRVLSRRYNQEYGDGTVSSIRYPDVETVRTGLFGYHRQTIAATKIEAGLRYDLVASHVNDMNVLPAVPGAAGASYNFSPGMLYTQYYGAEAANDPVIHLVSGRLRAERQVASGTTAYLNLAHLMRAPEAVEQFQAQSGGRALGQIGNPGLSPERHRQAEAGITTASADFKSYGRGAPPGAWQVAASAQIDRVGDFITADRARGQSGVLMGDGAVVYRNVDAELTYLKLGAQSTVHDGVAVRVDLKANDGRNLTDSRVLYQVAPYEANATVDLFGGEGVGEWTAGLHGRLVASKHRVDSSVGTGAGEDKGGPAAAFAVFDLNGSYRVAEGVAAVMGIENLLDRRYREHVEFFPLGPTVTQVAAPGRTGYVRMVVGF